MNYDPVTLVAGAHGVGKGAVISSLLSGNDERDTLWWSIETKYYVARVLLREHGDLSEPAQQPEALLLVIDCNQADSFDQARSWAQACSVQDAEVKLLIANKADLLSRDSQQQVVRPAWLLQAIDWCSSSGFEYIEACASTAELDAELELDGDPQGMLRVTQALHAHMWPGMKLKGGGSRAPNGGQAALAVLASSSATGDPSEVQQATDDGEELRPAGRTEPSGDWVAVVPSTADPRLGTEAAEEQLVDDFERLFHEIEGAKRRLGGMPDADRRSQAASMALRLASMFGLDESDDDLDESLDSD